MTETELRSNFADFLDRLAAAKGQIRPADRHTFVLNHFRHKEVEEMRRTLVRLQISWAYREWPDYNCELVQEWARRLRQPAVA